MKYDIVTMVNKARNCTEEFLAALKGLDYDKNSLRLIVAGEIPQNRQEEYRQKSGIDSVKTVSCGGGFSAVMNRRAKEGAAEYILFLPCDARICPGALKALEEYTKKNPGGTAFELRRIPTERSKHADPVSLETPWVNMDTGAVKRADFEQAGGFDERLPEIAAQVDLSWRLRRAVGRLIYCPGAAAWVKNAPSEKEEYILSVYSPLILSYKYGDFALIKTKNKEYIDTLRRPRHFDGVRKDLAKLYLGHFLTALALIKWRRKQPRLFAAGVCDFSPGFAPNRGLAAAEPFEGSRKVSVIVRTYRRKEVLRKTLESLRHQIYKDFTVVLIEDGGESARQMVKEEFCDLDIRYFNTGGAVGRGRAGNIGLEKSDGEYICFLDDDDYLYPDYLSSMLAKFSQNPRADIVLSGSMAAKISVESTDPYVMEYREFSPMIFDHITFMDMCVKCRIALPSAMFKRSLYEKYGGMREDIDGDEDWHMWLKFLAGANRINPYGVDIKRALCLFVDPADPKRARSRLEKYRVYDRQMLYDENLKFTFSGDEIQRWERYVKYDMEHLKNIGGLERFKASLTPLGKEELKYDPAGPNTVTRGQINSYYYFLAEKFSEN